jgi:predicted secreted hydrolase
LENWRVEQVDDQRFTLLASQDDIKLDLFFDNLKGVIFHGEQGYSQKGPEPGNASYYYSQTRLDTSGTIQIAEDVYRVSGLSWMDHEFSTSALSAGQVGWDWFSIQLDEGSELMVFQIRRADGSIDLYSSGTWIAKDGKTRQLSNEQFEIKVIDTWRSPNSGAEYPSEWLLVVPDLELQLEIKPLVADQEMDVSYAYWEGAVKIEGNQSDARVSGIGYVELTGYAESIEGQF